MKNKFPALVFAGKGDGRKGGEIVTGKGSTIGNADMGTQEG